MLVAPGLTNEQTATQMRFGRETIKNHVRSILAKRELTTRQQVSADAYARPCSYLNPVLGADKQPTNVMDRPCGRANHQASSIMFVPIRGTPRVSPWRR